MARNQRKREIARKWRQLPSWAWKLALYKADLNRAPHEPYAQSTGMAYVEGIDEANLITSESGRIEWTGKHRPVLDIDFPAALIPSTTDGHFHLFLDKELSWADYKILLKALAQAGIIQQGYADASIANKRTAVRLPWVRKIRHDYDKPIGPANQVLPPPPQRVSYISEPEPRVWHDVLHSNERITNPSYSERLYTSAEHWVTPDMQAHLGRLEYERRRGLLPGEFRVPTLNAPGQFFESPYLLRNGAGGGNRFYLATPWAEINAQARPLASMGSMTYEGIRASLTVRLHTGQQANPHLPAVTNAEISTRFTASGLEVLFEPRPEPLSFQAVESIRTRGVSSVTTRYNEL